MRKPITLEPNSEVFINSDSERCSRSGFCVPMRGKGLPPLAPHLHPRVQPPTSASLRTEYLDEGEQFAEQERTARQVRLMTFRSRPLRFSPRPIPSSLFPQLSLHCLTPPADRQYTR